MKETPFSMSFSILYISTDELMLKTFLMILVKFLDLNVSLAFFCGTHYIMYTFLCILFIPDKNAFLFSGYYHSTIDTYLDTNVCYKVSKEKSNNVFLTSFGFLFIWMNEWSESEKGNKKISLLNSSCCNYCKSKLKLDDDDERTKWMKSFIMNIFLCSCSL